MKKLLFIAVLLIGIAPQSVRAETWWLLIGGYDRLAGGAMSSIPTNSKDECNQAGDFIMNSKQEPNNIHGKIFSHMRYVCVQGK